jgi:uncharacterized protein
MVSKPKHNLDLAMTPTEFTPFASLIGLAAVLLMLTNGRTAGISGIAVRMFPPFLDKQALGRFVFILGLVAAPMFYAKITGAWSTMTTSGNTSLLLIAGLLVGFGSVWGNGCTSGHGICGLSRLSVRSLVAVATFMATAIITVYITRNVL